MASKPETVRRVDAEERQSRETVAREGIVPLCGRLGWASLLSPRSNGDQKG